MRGAVSAGMCVVLEAAGLVGAFDRIYGVSAGALNGCATAAGQAALSATYYLDAVSRRVISRRRALVRQPVIDYDVLFEDVISARKPLSFEALAHGPDFRCLATSLESLTLRVLGDFADAEDLVQAVRASAALPGIGGRPPIFRGEQMTDGGLIEPIPFETALAEGATHVLVLRTRPAGFRKRQLTGLGESLTVRGHPGLVQLLRDGHLRYNRQAELLDRRTAGLVGAQVLQIAPPETTRTVARLEADAGRVAEALALGAKAIASAILEDPIDLCWQPVVYRTEAVEATDRSAARPRPSHIAVRQSVAEAAR